MATRFDAGVIGNREISNTTGHEIEADRQWHLTDYTERFGLGIAATPTTQSVVLFYAEKGGKLADVQALLNDSGTSTAVTFDLLKNGLTILSSPISVVHGTGDRTPVAASFASSTAHEYAEGDVISCTVTATSTADAQGPMLAYSRLQRGD